MKKIFALSLLLSIILSGCWCKKKSNSNNIIISNNKCNKEKCINSQDTEEFILEDDTNFNVFEDENKSKIENEISWNEFDEENHQGDVVQFDFNSSNINETEKPKIKKNAKLLKNKLSKNKNSKITVRGHSCKIAKNKEYNYALSQERAQKVANAYNDLGIEKEKIKPVGFGSSMLLTDQDGMEEQSVNRRAETTLINS